MAGTRTEAEIAIAEERDVKVAEQEIAESGEIVISGDEKQLNVDDQVIDGGDEQEVLEEKEPELSARELLIKDMTESRKKEQADINGVGDQPGSEEDGEILPGEDDKSDEFTEIVVDGQKTLVKTEDVLNHGVRTLQKETSADRRLEQAKERETKISEREQALTDKENKFSQGLATDEEISADAKKFSDAIVEDENVAGEMFQKVMEDNRDLKAATAELINDGRATREEREATAIADRNQKVSHYYKNYMDIAESGFLNEKFNEHANQIGQADSSLTFEEICKQAGKIVRDEYVVEKREPVVPVDNARKQKRGMMKQPRKAGGRVRTTIPKPKRKTHADRINDMRVGRGQPAIE